MDVYYLNTTGKSLNCKSTDFVCHILYRYHKIPMESLNIEYNTYGKPYLSTQDIQFNISHNAHHWICAVDFNQVGIDIEEIGTAKEKIIKRFFSELEKQQVLKATSKEETDRFFFSIWTRKEAYLKYLGVGLSISLSSFDVVDLSAKEECCFENLIYNNACISICSRRREKVVFHDLAKNDRFAIPSCISMNKRGMVLC